MSSEAKNMLAQLFIVKCLLHTLSSHFVLIIQSKSKKHLNLHFNYEEGENGSCRSSQVLQLVSADVFISLICSQIGIQKAYLGWNSKQNLFIHFWVNWESRCCWGAYQIPLPGSGYNFWNPWLPLQADVLSPQNCQGW